MLAWRRLTPTAETLSSADIKDLISGALFKKRGLQNFLEQDFFSWLARPETSEVGRIVVERIVSLLERYDLEKLSEDVLKTLYQGLVDPAERNYLGEFYTPDWLANRVVNEALDEKEDGSILDPSCGSGSFLYLAIHEKRKRMGDSPATVRHILESVCGADIHPLAVIVAKTNYILALGDTLQKHRPTGTISIPIYLADTLKIPETFIGADEYGIDVDKQIFPLEKSLAQDPTRADYSIEVQNNWAVANKATDINIVNSDEWKPKFEAFLHANKLSFSPDEFETLWRGALVLHGLIRADRDSIWAYVIKNIYKPLALFDRFDFVLGNPPWVVLRNLETSYQARVSDQVTNYKLVSATGHLVTQIELATLFTLRAADLYLKVGGKIGFVLPRSIFSSDQHAGFRAQSYRLARSGWTLRLNEIWDLDKVRPLFNVPSCCVWGEKVMLGSEPKGAASLAGVFFAGVLAGKNESWKNAQKSLTETPLTYNLHEVGARTYWDDAIAGGKTLASPYKKQFSQGATIVPRSLWFVEVENSGQGFDPDRPPLVTDKRAIKEAKDPYKEVNISGVVENQYLFATLLSADLLPFGHFDFRLCVLPMIEALSAKNAKKAQKWEWQMRNADGARAIGHLELASWIDNAETIFAEKRGEKSGASSAIDWLNYSGKLTRQNPRKKWTVIYNSSGTNLAAAIVENGPKTFQIGSQEVAASGFVSDAKTYFFQSDDFEECLYLIALLNTPSINILVKPMQSKGLQGERDIHKKVWDLPIPLYDANNPKHLKLVELARECTQLVATCIADEPKLRERSIGRARTDVRVRLSKQLSQIDAIVINLMK